MLINIMWGVLTTISVLLIACVLMQSKGQGFNMSFGGAASGYRTRRGAEKLVFNATIVLGVLFGVVALLLAILSQ